MNRAARAAYWAAPSLLCLAVYWYGVTAWFQADDFAWLILSLEVKDWPSFLDAMFLPRAQGTIRPWSERAFFMGFYALFGLDALPFRIWAFLTQFANLALVASIAARLTRSRAAGFWAAVFWGGNACLAPVLTWSSAYNQALAAFFILLAFHFLLRFIETGRRRYEVLQWVVFLLGFGAQELNVVYPVLAGGYTLLAARKHFRRTVPMFAVSLAYALLHLRLAPSQATGLYAMHFDPRSLVQTLGTYWGWTLAAPWLVTPWELPKAWMVVAVALITAALLGFTAWRAWRGDRLPAFFLLWYLAAMGPLLPLRDHLTEYYPYAGAIGLAMLGGAALAHAFRRAAAWKAAAAVTAAVYLLLAVPGGRTASKWMQERSRRVEALVLGIARAHQLHPSRTILLHGVDSALFWTGFVDHPYRLLGTRAYLTPGSEKTIAANPDYGDVTEYVLPAEATAKALERGTVVVYDASVQPIRNITRVYNGLFRYEGGAAPRRIDATSPLMDYLFGPTWYPVDQWTRWMPEKGALRIGGPIAPSQKLIVRAICPRQSLDAGPVELRATAAGVPLAPVRISTSDLADFAFALPAAAVGRDSIDVNLEVSRAYLPPGDGRHLGLAVAVVEIR